MCLEERGDIFAVQFVRRGEAQFDLVVIFAVGCEADRQAGTPGFVITPWFKTTRGLVAHCEAGYEQIIEKGAPEC